jgi:hypothetical protein
VILNEARDLTIASNYKEFQLPVAGRCSISSAYNDKLTFGKPTSLNIDESKYPVIRIGFLDGSGEGLFKYCYQAVETKKKY